MKTQFMDAEELARLAQKLSSQGMTDSLKNGKEAIPVSLMIPERFTETSREVRKELLKNEFEKKLDNDVEGNLEVDFSKISVSGQTVQAKLDINSIHPVLDFLKEKQIEIYPNINKDVI